MPVNLRTLFLQPLILQCPVSQAGSYWRSRWHYTRQMIPPTEYYIINVPHVSLTTMPSGCVCTWIYTLIQMLESWFPYTPTYAHKYTHIHIYPDSKVHGANMGPTWVLSAPDGPHELCSHGMYLLLTCMIGAMYLSNDCRLSVVLSPKLWIAGGYTDIVQHPWKLLRTLIVTQLKECYNNDATGPKNRSTIPVICIFSGRNSH